MTFSFKIKSRLMSDCHQGRTGQLEKQVAKLYNQCLCKLSELRNRNALSALGHSKPRYSIVRYSDPLENNCSTAKLGGQGYVGHDQGYTTHAMFLVKVAILKECSTDV